MGSPNISVSPFFPTNHVTIMSRVAEGFTNVSGRIGAGTVEFTARDASPSIVVGLLFVIAVIMLLRVFFNTEVGYAIRATGDNEPMSKAQGISTDKMKVFGLMLGNACAALAGALIVQENFSADANMGAGMIVVGLAAVIIGEVFLRDKNNYRAFIAVVIGSVIYRFIIAFVLRYGNPHDFQLFIAIIIALALSLPMIRDKFNIRLKKNALGNKGGE
jgi:putative ABC transport system permease protein